MSDMLREFAAELGLSGPEFDAEMEKAMQRRAELRQVRCNYGNCVNDVDPNGRIVGGMGPVMCPCDMTRGWNRKYPDQQGKPHPPIKSRSPKVLRRRREAKELDGYMRRLKAANW